MSKEVNEGCLSAGGAAGMRLRSIDWDNHPLGPVARWPHSLKAVVRLLLQCSSPMFIWWGNGRTTIYNEGAIPLFGSLDPDAMGGSGILPGADDAGRITAAVDELLQTGTSTQLVDEPFQNVAADGEEEAYFTLDFNPLSDDDGAVCGFLCICSDQTQRVLGERRLSTLLESERSARADAERAGRMKDEFLSTLSHELRTPLNAILGYATFMRMSKIHDEQLNEAVVIIERNAKQQARLIEDLLDMNRIASGKVRLQVEPLQLSDSILQTVSTIRPTAEAKGIEIDIAIDPYAGHVRGDPARMQQILWNLLTNAIKFTGRGGKVRLALTRVESHAEISISDTGQGIAKEFLPFVFDYFRQADSSMTRRYEGLGLGLAIVRHLVEMHGGTIRAESAGVGEGTTFVVAFPLLAVQLEADGSIHGWSAREAAAGMNITLDGVRVLVVDDEPDATLLVQRVLEDCKAKVDMAGSAKEAIMLLTQKPFDVLVSDIGMPDEDGYALIRQIRDLKEKIRDIPAVALTAFARSEDRRRAALAGFQTHLAKPVEAEELIAIVANLSGRTNTHERER